jgi:hypothetical protein
VGDGGVIPRTSGGGRYVRPADWLSQKPVRDYFSDSSSGIGVGSGGVILQ